MRLYRMSEVWVFFWKAGIEILRNHKPDMDKGFVRDRGKAFYYGSLEFKDVGSNQGFQIMCGALSGYCVSCLQYHGSKYEMGEKNGMFHAYLDRANALKGRI